MEFKIRKATKPDVPQILKLIKELAVFEKEPYAVEVTENNLISDGFGANPAFNCFVATSKNKVVGMALVYQRYSTWKGKTLHLEDLIVENNYRGKGLGTLLLDEVMRYAQQLKVKRVTWEVLNWNTPAINFYINKGATILKEWQVVHLNEKAIQNYFK